MIDEALSIARKMTCIEVLMIGMLAEIFASGSARIKVANAIMIGEEIDTFTNPARICNIPIETQEALECSTTRNRTRDDPLYPPYSVSSVRTRSYCVQ